MEILVLRNPPVNALSRAVIDSLGSEFQGLPRETRSVVLTGEGTYFSAGADLKELASIGVENAPALVEKVHATFRTICEYPAPVIGALNGLTVGGGLELALCCDLRIAVESAKLGSPEVSYGLLPGFGGTQRLPRLVGSSQAKELMFTGKLLSAVEALRIGLVNRVVPSGQELRAARDLAHTIAQKAPLAVAASKRLLNHATELTLVDGLREEQNELLTSVLSSEDLAEGLLAFREHRPPKFQGA